jgi:hypothetical protein
MKRLNHRFDVDLPFDESIALECGDGDLTDDMFDQAIEEFEISEDEGMDLLLESEKYEFIRKQEGWGIREI